MSKKIVVSFHYISNARPEPRMTMMDDSDGGGTQTFIAEVGKPLQFANPSEYDQLSFVIDEVIEDE